MKIAGIILLIVTTLFLSVDWYVCYIKDACLIKDKNAKFFIPKSKRKQFLDLVEAESKVKVNTELEVKTELEAENERVLASEWSGEKKETVAVKKKVPFRTSQKSQRQPSSVRKLKGLSITQKKALDKFKIVRGRIHFLPKAKNISQSPSVKYHLDSVYKKWKRNKRKKIVIIGHTDNQGSSRSNYRLGLKRAKQVRSLLVKKGIDPSKIKAISYGESKPIGKNYTKGGRFYNRRVEIKFK